MKYLPLIRAIGTLTLVAGMTVSDFGAVNAVTFDPPDASSPERSRGGASRGSSDIRVRTTTQPSVLALLPQSDRGTTQLERPTILVYLSQAIGGEAIFSVRDADNNPHCQMRVPVSGNVGIVAIQLPEDAPALEVDRSYQWSLDFQDSENADATSSTVRGWIQRVESGAIGAEVWYDAVAALARLRSARPEDTDIDRQWQELLGSIGLENLATAPIVEVP